MTKADYDLVAKILRETVSCDDAHCHINLASAFAAVFQELNPRFDKVKFLKAVLQDEHGKV